MEEVKMKVRVEGRGVESVEKRRDDVTGFGGGMLMEKGGPVKGILRMMEHS